MCSHPFRPLGLPIYVARVPAAPFSLLLYVDHSHGPVLAPATLAALPSIRAIPDRDVFYVAHLIRSIRRRPAFAKASAWQARLPLQLFSSCIIARSLKDERYEAFHAALIRRVLVGEFLAHEFLFVA